MRRTAVCATTTIAVTLSVTRLPAPGTDSTVRPGLLHNISLKVISFFFHQTLLALFYLPAFQSDPCRNLFGIRRNC